LTSSLAKTQIDLYHDRPIFIKSRDWGGRERGIETRTLDSRPTLQGFCMPGPSMVKGKERRFMTQLRTSCGKR
jgi:hypothetical protein